MIYNIILIEIFIDLYLYIKKMYQFYQRGKGKRKRYEKYAVRYQI